MELPFAAKDHMVGVNLHDLPAPGRLTHPESPVLTVHPQDGHPDPAPHHDPLELDCKLRVP
jgi:hypothetical protein